MNGDDVVTEGQWLGFLVVAIHRRRLLHLHPEHRALPGSVVVQRLVGPVKIDRRLQLALGLGDARHVVNVGVGEQDVTDLQAPTGDEIEQLHHLVARIDVHGFFRTLAAEHVAVLHKRASGR